MESAETVLPGSTEVEGRPNLALLGKTTTTTKNSTKPQNTWSWGEKKSRRLVGGARQRASTKMGLPASGPLGVCETRCLLFRREL